jgi:hypothetical protein
VRFNFILSANSFIHPNLVRDIHGGKIASTGCRIGGFRGGVNDPSRCGGQPICERATCYACVRVRVSAGVKEMDKAELEWGRR